MEVWPQRHKWLCKFMFFPRNIRIFVKDFGLSPGGIQGSEMVSDSRSIIWQLVLPWHRVHIQFPASLFWVLVVFIMFPENKSSRFLGKGNGIHWIDYNVSQQLCSHKPRLPSRLIKKLASPRLLFMCGRATTASRPPPTLSKEVQLF